MEDEETLETGTLVSKLTNTIEDQVNDFLSDGVMTTSVVVRGILLTSDELLGVEKLTVGSGTNLIYIAEKSDIFSIPLSFI